MSSIAFNFKTREQDLSELEKQVWDLVVIGGGITGAAVARDASLRGLNTLLIEANDFASGTSSGSTKLIHGGIRYLENFEFKLVFEAIQEREKLFHLYAPLVKELWFCFPTYKKTHPPRWMLHLGLSLYDAFAGFDHPHRNLAKKETLKLIPEMNSENLTGSCLYLDAFAEDYRLVIELIKSAHRQGATCLSRMKVEGVAKSSTGFQLQMLDRWGSEKKIYSVPSRFVMNCSGPFSNEVRKLLSLPEVLKLTQGVHFLVPHKRLPIAQALVLPDPQLKRILFAIPWKSTTFLGTTDTDIRDPREARASSEDLKYVLRIVNSYLKVNLQTTDIIQSWAAVRPLIKPHSSEANSQISREHQIEENPRGFFHILGGKLTSHRLMAEEALNLLDGRIRMQDCMTASIPLLVESAFKASLSEPISPLTEIRTDDVKESILSEMALRPIDFARRRSSLYYEDPSREVAEKLSQIFADTMHWSSSEKDSALKEVLDAYAWDQKGFRSS